MKCFGSREHRVLLEMLTTARQRAALTPAELANKVSAGPEFALNYESGEHGPVVLSARAGPERREVS